MNRIILAVMFFIVGCSSTKYRSDEEVRLYAKGFFHGCTYIESKKDFNLSGLSDCANKEKQLIEYYKKIGTKR